MTFHYNSFEGCFDPADASKSIEPSPLASTSLKRSCKFEVRTCCHIVGPGKKNKKASNIQWSKTKEKQKGKSCSKLQDIAE